jgi:polyhydroxyalkanoate synthase
VTPPASVAPLAEQIGCERNDTLVVRSGHIGLLVGGSARKQTLPKITEWLASVEAEGKNSKDG